MDHTLKYLRESLSNYSENEMCQQIIAKLEENQYSEEIEFVKDLSEEEISYLDQVLENELDYARNAQDEVRTKQLLEVFEQLF
ncbi:sporulation protein [Compostibacillus humi]|uniref:sporulation protein n=1 Tax=Compostibacillus humi TaxID=1245525 RepID=UPI00166BAFDA|nr:sporulation protein [Compostibacillus humi]